MLDNISESTNNHSNSQPHHHHHHLQKQQSTNTNSQVTVDFDSILQELKSVGQAHQSEQQTTMIVENITANIKTEPLTNTSNETSMSYYTRILYHQIEFIFVLVSTVKYQSSSDDLLAFLSSNSTASLPSINTMMLSTVPTPTLTTSPVRSPKKKGTKSNSTSPRIKKEGGTVIKSKACKKTKVNTIDSESLQQILIKTNGEFSEPMHIVLASPVKHQPSTTTYSPIAPAINKKNNNETTTNSWMTTNISQTTKNAQALALKAVARNQVAKINFQQQQQQQQQQQAQQAMDTGKRNTFENSERNC